MENIENVELENEEQENEEDERETESWEESNFIMRIFGRKPIEETIRQNVIIPTFVLGTIGAIIDAAYLYNTNGITLACTTLLFGIGGVWALCILLAGFAEIIMLLRQIAEK